MNLGLREIIEKHIKEIGKRDFENVVYDALANDVFDNLLSVFAETKEPISPDFTVLPRNFDIDTTRMPSCLKNAHFIAWLKKFNQLLVKIGLPEWKLGAIDLSVVFSDEEKTEHFGSLTIEELKEIIRDTWGTSEEIEKILEKIDGIEDFRMLIQELMDAIHRICSGSDYSNPEYLYTYLEELEFEMPVLGEYINSKKQIILYTPNIEKAAVDHGNISSREFEKVFIHELFHAYHYNSDKGELINRRDYTAKVVKESLASAFEWFYCIENKINGSDELKSSWDNYSVLFYPYSGARDLLSEIGRFTGNYTLNRKKFFDVFDRSLTDMDNALRILLDSFCFYRVKNLIYIREKKVVTKPKTRGTYADFCTAMKAKKVGQIAREEIPPIISRKPFLVNDLLDKSYCEKNFYIPAAAISTAQVLLPCGDRKYYADPKVNANGNKYYLYMHWRESHRGALLDWIWANR